MNIRNDTLRRVRDNEKSSRGGSFTQNAWARVPWSIDYSLAYLKSRHWFFVPRSYFVGQLKKWTPLAIWFTFGCLPWTSANASLVLHLGLYFANPRCASTCVFSVIFCPETATRRSFFADLCMRMDLDRNKKEYRHTSMLCLCVVYLYFSLCDHESRYFVYSAKIYLWDRETKALWDTRCVILTEWNFYMDCACKSVTLHVCDKFRCFECHLNSQIIDIHLTQIQPHAGVPFRLWYISMCSICVVLWKCDVISKLVRIMSYLLVICYSQSTCFVSCDVHAL